MAEDRVQQKTGMAVGVVLGALLTVALLFGAGYVYLHFGHPPVAVEDAPFPFERQIAHGALQARIAREIRPAPFAADPATLLAGARVYAEQCAGCHGTPGQPRSSMEKMVFPHVPGLWQRHPDGVVGVSDDPTGATYWVVANGIRLSAMPEFHSSLSEQQMWQVSLLLKNADQTLPPEVLAVLNAPPADAAQKPAP